jgi:hypothetical protein
MGTEADRRCDGGYRWFCRGTASSSSNGWIVAAAGIATETPISPISVAMMVSPGMTLTEPCL